MRYFIQILLVSFSILLISCTGNKEKNKGEQLVSSALEVDEYKIDSTFFHDKPERLFLEFWYGMSQDQFYIVADYLVKEGIINYASEPNNFWDESKKKGPFRDSLYKYYINVPSGGVFSLLNPEFENGTLRAIKISVPMNQEKIGKNKFGELIELFKEKYKKGKVSTPTLWHHDVSPSLLGKDGETTYSYSSEYDHLFDFQNGSRYVKIYERIRTNKKDRGVSSFSGRYNNETIAYDINTIFILYSESEYVRKLHKELLNKVNEGKEKSNKRVKESINAL